MFIHNQAVLLDGYKSVEALANRVFLQAKITLEQGFLPTESTSSRGKNNNKEMVLVLRIILFSNIDTAKGSLNSYPQNVMKT